jgi:hypothetical protein
MKTLQKNTNLACSRLNRFRPLGLSTLLLACSGLLVACGGGQAPPAASLVPSQLKGRWVNASVTPAMTALLVPGTNGESTAWLLPQDASKLVKLVVRSDNSISGLSYALSPADANGQSVSGQITTALNASPASISLTGINASALSLTRTDDLSSQAIQADITGAWRATLGGNSVVIQWALEANGLLSGSSTTGCTYTGNLTPMAGTAAYNAQFVEKCSGSLTNDFRGIAVVSPAKDALTLVAVKADESKGAAFFFTKTPI